MKKISQIIQWFFAVSFALMSFSTGSIVSGIIVFIAAVLMAPIKPIREILQKIKIKSVVAIILSVVLLFAGVIISPDSEVPNDVDTPVGSVGLVEDVDEKSTESTTENTTENTTIESTTESTTETTTEESTTETTTKKSETTTKKVETTTKKIETTTKKVTTTVNPDTQITVYYTKTGEKYHYENPCGNGTYYPCTLAEAKARGLDPCDKCVLH